MFFQEKTEYYKVEDMFHDNSYTGYGVIIKIHSIFLEIKIFD